MSDFQDMQERLHDFLTEAGELLSDVDNKLVELERAPDDVKLLNDIFRGFHTIKGGAGFLNVQALVGLCHLTENLFDPLRNGKLKVTPEVLDVILSATSVVRGMFDQLAGECQPAPAAPKLCERLEAARRGESAPVVATATVIAIAPAVAAAKAAAEADWEMLYHAVLGSSVPAPVVTLPLAASAPALVAEARQGRRASDSKCGARETTVRVDTHRLDDVLNLSAQVGDRSLIQVSEDGRGMRAERLRRKAVDKGLLSSEEAMGLDDASSFKLIFLPGFSTKGQVSDVSGRGVGMDVVKTNLQKLNGHIEIESRPGAGTTFSITLPLTRLVLAVDSFAGREDVIVKPLSDVTPPGVAGVTLASDGAVVGVLEIDALLKTEQNETHAALFGPALALARAA